MTSVEARKLLHAVERHEFIDRLRHEATRQGRFDRTCWHLDHPIPGTHTYLMPSDHGAGAERIYAAVEETPRWQKLWRQRRRKLSPRKRAVLDALKVDWRSRPAARIAGVSQPTVDTCKTFFKMHFAQCHQVWKRDFAI